MKYNYIIGIDPDCEKSGVATLRTDDKHIECDTRSFPMLVEYLFFLKKMGDSVIILVEASWLTTHNWHTTKYDSKASAAAKGNAVGRNQETGRKIVEIAKHFELEVKEVLPLRKCWKGPDGKISYEEISQFIHGLPKRTNQETRDAALLAWNFAGFPIKMRVKSGIKYP